MARWPAGASGLDQVGTPVVVVETAETKLLGVVTAATAAGVLGVGPAQPAMPAESRLHPIPGMTVTTTPSVVPTAWTRGAAAGVTVLRVPVPLVRISWKPIPGMPARTKTDSAGQAGRRRSVVAISDLPHRPDDVVKVVTVLMTAAKAGWETPSAHPAVMVVPMQSITLAGQTTAAAPQAAVRLAISTNGFVIRLDTNGSRPGSMLPPAEAQTSPTSSHAIATHPLGHLL